MANGTRRRSSGGRSSGSAGRGGAGGGRRAPARGGGGSNAMPIIVGIVILGAVVAVIALGAGGKKKPKEPYVSKELTADSNRGVTDKGGAPKRPERAPPPKIPLDIIETAKHIVAEMEEDKAQGDALYEEAMKAKTSGDRETWQAKLKEAAEHFGNIKERWNTEIIGEIDAALPSGCEWDAEEVANHWLGTEGGKVAKALERLAYIKKQLGTQ